jgi:hypothetical protein
MSGGEIIAIFAGIIAALATGYLVATLLEKLSEPVYPDVQDDPRAIDILRRGQICPWPTEGEVAAHTKIEGGTELQARAAVTQQSGTIARSHKGGV